MRLGPHEIVAAIGAAGMARITREVFSPDGKWLAYGISVNTGVLSANHGMFVQPVPPTGAIYQVPKAMVDFHPPCQRRFEADPRAQLRLSSALVWAVVLTWAVSREAYARRAIVL